MPERLSAVQYGNVVTSSNMRFEVLAAFAVGGLIMVLGTWLEFCRNGYRLTLADVAGNLDDNVAGVALVAAAPLVLRGTSYAKVTLVAAWAYCTSLMFSSSWGQLQDTWSGHAEPENSVILVFKLAILSSCAAEMALSIRRAAGR